MNRKSFVLSILFLIFTSSLIFSQETPQPQNSQENQETNNTQLKFSEIWAYVMTGEENRFKAEYPITDVGYFISAVSIYGNINEVPPKEKYFSDYKGRVHLVTSCDSRGQTHLLLDPKLGARKQIINQLVEAAKTYDGLQIDWELVPQKDWEYFYDFLKTLKKKLKGKMLTIAVPARKKTLEIDPYDYARMSQVCDKILIMAYDQHWSTSTPGPIASPKWGNEIYEYAKTIIPEEKLIMGAPFYSRAWSNEDIGGKAWRNRSVTDILKDNKIKEKDIKTDSEGNKYIKLKKERTITLYFDDTQSSLERLKVYKNSNLDRIGFWRVGQENDDFWQNLKIKEN